MFQPCGYPIIVFWLQCLQLIYFFQNEKKIRLKTLSSSLVKKWRGAHANAKHVMFIVYFVCFGEGATETFWLKNWTFWRSRKEKNNTDSEFRGVLLLQLWINCQLQVMSPSKCPMIKTQSCSWYYNNFNVVSKKQAWHWISFILFRFRESGLLVYNNGRIEEISTFIRPISMSQDTYSDRYKKRNVVIKLK